MSLYLLQETQPQGCRCMDEWALVCTPHMRTTAPVLIGSKEVLLRVRVIIWMCEELLQAFQALLTSLQRPATRHAGSPPSTNTLTLPAHLTGGGRAQAGEEELRARKVSGSGHHSARTDATAGACAETSSITHQQSTQGTTQSHHKRSRHNAAPPRGSARGSRARAAPRSRSLLGVGDAHGLGGRDLEQLQPGHGHRRLRLVLKLHKRDAWPRLHHAHLRAAPGVGAAGRRAAPCAGSMACMAGRPRDMRRQAAALAVTAAEAQGCMLAAGPGKGGTRGRGGARAPPCTPGTG